MSLRAKKRLSSAAAQTLCLLLGAAVVFPVVYGIFGAFKQPAEFASWPPGFLPESFANTENFRYVFEAAPMFRYLLNSLIVATAGSFLRLSVALLAAYALTFFRFRGKRLFFVLMMGTMMLPGDIVLITNYQTVSALGLTNTYLGLMIVSLVGASQMFMLRQSFRQTPAALREASFLDGCGDFRFIFSVLLPLSTPVLVTLFLQSFVALWNVYLWPLVITSADSMRTVQIGIAMLTTYDGTNFHTVLAGVTVALVPIFLLFLVLRRHISSAMTAGALVG